MTGQTPLILFADPLSDSDRAVVDAASARTGIAVGVVNEAGQLPAETLAAATALVTGQRTIASDDIAAAPNLRLIQRLELGNAAIDREAAAARDIPVVELLNLGWLGVTEHTMLLMLALVKQLPTAHARTAAGERKPGVSEVKTTAREYTFSWLGQAGLGWLYRKRLGLIGIGRIGRGVAARAAAFGMQVSYFAPHRLEPSTEERLGLDYRPLAELLGWADFVSVHAKLTDQNHEMFGAAEFVRMRPDAYFINTARGALVDEAALIAALASGQIAGAGLDVFEYEPIKRDNPLLRLGNVILTPHSAGIFNDDARVAQLNEAFARVEELTPDRSSAQ